MELVTIGIALILTVISTIKSRKKSRSAIDMARGMFKKTFIDLIGVLLIIGGVLAIIPPDLIRSLLGGKSRIISTLWGTLIGTVSIIPAFIAFPLSKSLLENGAHLMTVAGFLTTLTMVGVATFPIESSYFGKKFTIYRNVLSLIGALLIALIMGGIMK